MNRRAPTAALAALTVGLLASCSSSGDQGSPDGVVKAIYVAIGKGEFATACSLLDDQVKQNFSRNSATCEVAMARQYPTDKRTTMVDINVNTEGVDTSADVVTFPASAVTFGGQPANDGKTTVVKRDDKWWVTRN